MAAARDIDIFCRAVEARSAEHRDAMAEAMLHGWWAIAGSVLRMELDSMIRVIYLLHAPDARDRILASCVAGLGFKEGKGKRRIQDADMKILAIADNDWVDAVYEFGNKFVHLTDAHDYAEAEADPFQVYEHRDQVIEYLNSYHSDKMSGRRLEDGSTLHDVAAYAPHVLAKITSNLNSYIKSLRAAVGENDCSSVEDAAGADGVAHGGGGVQAEKRREV